MLTVLAEDFARPLAAHRASDLRPSGSPLLTNRIRRVAIMSWQKVAIAMSALAVVGSPELTARSEVTLDAMIRDADRIVFGKVHSITDSFENKTLNDFQGPILIRTLLLREFEVLKGDHNADCPAPP